MEAILGERKSSRKLRNLSQNIDQKILKGTLYFRRNDERIGLNLVLPLSQKIENILTFPKITLN